MPSSRYRHIGPMLVADLGPSSFAPWANVVSTSAFLNRPDAGSTSACHRQSHRPSIGPMMGSCPLLHHWPDAGSTSANSSAQYRPDDGLMPCFASIGPLLDLHRQLNSPASAQSRVQLQVCLATCDDGPRLISRIVFLILT